MTAQTGGRRGILGVELYPLDICGDDMAAGAGRVDSAGLNRHIVMDINHAINTVIIHQAMHGVVSLLGMTVLTFCRGRGDGFPAVEIVGSLEFESRLEYLSDQWQRILSVQITNNYLQKWLP